MKKKKTKRKKHINTDEFKIKHKKYKRNKKNLKRKIMDELDVEKTDDGRAV